MATTDGANFAIAESPTPSNLLEVQVWGGRVRAIVDKVTVTETLATQTIIRMGKMPKGALPLHGFLRFTGASTATLQIGYTGRLYALGNATELTTTKTQSLYPSATQCNSLLTQPRDIYATVRTAPIVTAEVLDFQYLYSVPS